MSGLVVVHPEEASLLEVFSVGIYILQQLSLHHLLVVRRAAATWKGASVPSFHNDPALVYCFSMRRMHVRYLEGEKRKKEKHQNSLPQCPNAADSTSGIGPVVGQRSSSIVIKDDRAVASTNVGLDIDRL